MLTPAQLQQVKAAYVDVDVDGLASISPRVANNAQVALKFFRPGEDAMARTEAALLQHLQALRSPHVRVQQLVSTSSGAPLLIIDERQVLLTRFVHGTRKSYSELVDDEWRGLGVGLAALHDALIGATPGVPLLRDSLQRLDVVGELERIQRDQNTIEGDDVDGAAFSEFFSDRAALLREYGPRCRAHLDAISTWAPIHNDYNENNYLFVDGSPPFILDWDRAILAPHEYDVVRCLNHLPLVAPARAAAFLAGYRALRALDPGLLAWSVAAALVSHAVKHWPVEKFFAGEPGARERLRAMAEMVRVLVRRRRELDAFFGAAA